MASGEGRWDSRTALVVDGARGIGLAIARALDAEGAQLVITDPDPGVADAAARAFGQAGFQCNPADAGSVGRMAYAAADLVEDIDTVVLVLNGSGVASGSGLGRNSLATDEAAFEALVAARTKPLYRIARQFVPAMKARGAGQVLVVVAQGAGPDPWQDGAVGFVASAVRGLAAEWAADGVRVNALVVARDDTPPLPRFLAAKNPPAAPPVPLAVLPQAAEVAALALSILGEGGRAISGQVIRMDGGRDLPAQPKTAPN